MDVACNIGFTSDKDLALDGWDEILFMNEVPYVEKAFSGYDLQNREHVYYEALNSLSNYKFIGIKRKDPSDKLEFAGKVYAFEHHYNEIVDQCNEILYIQTSAISTIAVHEQWQK